MMLLVCVFSIEMFLIFHKFSYFNCESTLRQAGQCSDAQEPVFVIGRPVEDGEL